MKVRASVNRARKHIARLDTLKAIATYEQRIEKHFESGALTEKEFNLINDAFVERVYQIERAQRVKYQSLERQWFALHMGELYPLGDCGDFGDALETVRDQFGDESEAEWIAPYSAVAAWCDVVNNVRARFE